MKLREENVGEQTTWFLYLFLTIFFHSIFGGLFTFLLKIIKVFQIHACVIPITVLLLGVANHWFSSLCQISWMNKKIVSISFPRTSLALSIPKASLVFSLPFDENLHAEVASYNILARCCFPDAWLRLKSSY